MPCRTCRHADLSSKDAIKTCVHPFFEQPLPATIDTRYHPLQNQFRIVEDRGGESVNRYSLIQNTITECPLYEERPHAKD